MKIVKERNYKRIEAQDLVEFSSICGESYVLTDAEAVGKYGSDETEDLHFPPEVIIKPATAEEISSILRYCNHHLIPVTPRGGGTGLSGGALPIFGGVVLSMERFNQIIKIDELNQQAIVQPGVITQVLQEACIVQNLYYPPDPSSRGSCFIGGNLAENAGGPRAVKYGVTKDFILGLEAVLPSGEIIKTGAYTLKNSTGYNLTQLLTGSEGTLAVITKIILKLVPYPRQSLTMLVPFNSETRACEAVSAIFRAGVTPSALEFMERSAIEWTLHYNPDIQVNLPEEVKAHLLIECDGQDFDAVMKECETVSAVLEEYGAGEILFAQTAAEKESVWKLRRRVAEAVKSNSVYKEEDTVVPRYRLPELLAGVKEVGNRYGFQSVCYGHAGDGNLHVNIIKGELADDFWKNELPKAIREIFKLCVELGGTLSGEHGIGWVQKEYMDIAFSETELNLQKGIKDVFDPNGILNPGKIFT